MLTLLRIRNLAVVESVEIEPGAGLNVLTGESGAGKSVVLEALALLFGERANPGIVRAGADAAEVEGCFDLERGESRAPIRVRPCLVRAWLEEHGFNSTEEELILRREVQARGKSRAWINGKLATVSQLAELGARMAELHGQSASLALAAPSRQRDLFDGLAGLGERRAALGAAWSALAEARRELADLEREERDACRRLDFLKFQVAEIDELELRADEENELRGERDRLAHVDALQGGLARLETLLNEGAEEVPAARDLLGDAVAELEKLARLDATLAPHAEQLTALADQLNDVARDLSTYAGRIESDPERLHAIEARLDSVRRLERKYGAGVAAILATRETLAAEAAELEGRGERREALAARAGDLETQLLREAAKLTAARRKAAPGFAKRVRELLKDLALPGARFEVAFEESGANALEMKNGARVAADGAERIEFRFSANAGEQMAPLGDVASGGELSRVMLALHALSAETEGVPLLVFDEIDTGLSGQGARRLADVLARLAEHRQVLCVTHQPIVASRAERHFALAKSERRGRTIVSVEVVCEEKRRAELARLIDGGASAKSLELAGEMLTA